MKGSTAGCIAGTIIASIAYAAMAAFLEAPLKIVVILGVLVLIAGGCIAANEQWGKGL